MAETELRLNASGIRQLFKSGEVQEVINQEAQRICNSANASTSINSKPDGLSNPPFMWAGHTNSVSYRARVFASSPHGLRAEAKYKALSRSAGMK